MWLPCHSTKWQLLLPLSYLNCSHGKKEKEENPLALPFLFGELLIQLLLTSYWPDMVVGPSLSVRKDGKCDIGLESYYQKVFTIYKA
jgi:hypothetical protein